MTTVADQDDEKEAQLLGALAADTRSWEEAQGRRVREISLAYEVAMGRRIQALREQRGWSQAEFAEQLGRRGFEMHQTTVAKLERGGRPLRVAEAVAIALMFGLPPAALFALPIDGEPYGVEYMRKRLEQIEAAKDESARQMERAIRTHASRQAELEAEARWYSQQLRQSARGDDGEHQEEA